MKKWIIGNSIMKDALLLFLLILHSFFVLGQLSGSHSEVQPAPEKAWTVVIHGGAGGPPKGTFTDEEEAAYSGNLNQALNIGSSILENGGSSVDAVEAVIRFLEDCPLFNAGKGAVLSADGIAELDASIMDGKTLKAGAVAGVTTIRNPVSAARKVMENSPHVLLVDKGAEAFAKAQGLEIVDPSYFITEPVLKKWEKIHEQNRKEDDKSKGTVGAVALDKYGNLAAATSTGGMMNKMHGRIGDSPIIGAGTYANNNTCAVSCTGHGEYFIRNVVAYDLSALIEYKGVTLEEAARYIIMEKIKNQGAAGGLIAVDRNGNIAMIFNTNLMFRGFCTSAGEKDILIY